MQKNLVFDVEFHMGEDTDFYLRKDFQSSQSRPIPNLSRLRKVVFAECNGSRAAASNRGGNRPCFRAR